MSGFFFIPLFVFLIVASYTAVSYPVLKWLKVKDSLPSRSIKFGSSIFFMQAIPSLVAKGLGITFAGNIVGLIVSFLYVKKVLNISPYKNIAIILLLPFAAVVIMAIVILIFGERVPY